MIQRPGVRAGHSDPKLISAMYTHVMNDTKAEALAKLPAITANHPEAEDVAKTGMDDAPFMQVKTVAGRGKVAGATSTDE